MILFHNQKDRLKDDSYALVFAKNAKGLMDGHSDEKNYKKMYNRKFYAPEDFKDEFYSMNLKKDSSLITAASLYLAYIYSTNEKFRTIFTEVLTILGIESQDLRVKSLVEAPLTTGSDVWGVATLRYLNSNRASRTSMNDITFIMLAARESGFALHPTPWSTSTAYSADVGIVNKKYVDAVALSYGGRQKGWWQNTVNLFGSPAVVSFGQYPIGVLTPDALLSLYPALGCLPWWAQAMIFDKDLVLRAALSNKHKYLSVTKTAVDRDPTFRSCYYPYVLVEQPGINSKRVSELKNWTPIKNMDPLFRELSVKQTQADILTNGVQDPEYPLFKCQGLLDSQWLNLVSGVAANDLTPGMLDRSIASKESLTINSLGFTFGANTSTKSAELRSYCNSGYVTPGVSLNRDGSGDKDLGYGLRVVPLQKRFVII